MLCYLDSCLMNRRLHAEIETVFLVPAEAYTYLSSSLVKEVAFFVNGDSVFSKDIYPYQYLLDVFSLDFIHRWVLRTQYSVPKDLS